MSAENISLLQQVRESINTTSRVAVDATGCDISDIISQLNCLDGVEDVDTAREDDGRHDVWGRKDGEDFRLIVTATNR